MFYSNSLRDVSAMLRTCKTFYKPYCSIEIVTTDIIKTLTFGVTRYIINNPDYKLSNTDYTLAYINAARSNNLLLIDDLLSRESEEYQLIRKEIMKFFYHSTGKSLVKIYLGKTYTSQYERSILHPFSKALALYSNIEISKYHVMLILFKNNKMEHRGLHMLHYAAYFGLDDYVKYLIKEMNISVDIRDTGFTKSTPLMYTTCCDRISTAKILLGLGADINLQSGSNYTALHNACHFNKSEYVKLLLEYNPCLTFKNEDNMTALDIAKRFNYTEIIRLLQ